eukprot:TRINITY_DN4404_c0_g1_i1.p1 TRINITY_DN4404_c0_g1~~TRINITY_DN4404_c0_g1_i1.p1  ORF type:complete len:335 (+),score=68.76 TRINITY_DN4404_c0_g1_i1:47-1051(+)
MAFREAGHGASSGSGSTSSVRRIQRELKEISESPSRHWTAGPANDDLFEWIFAIRGPPDTDFQGGIYTGRIVLPVNYPFAPPSITLLTPNGRWEVGKKICLSNTSYHPDLWQPAWGIRTMMEALRSHFPVPGDGAIGAIDWPSDLRQRLAKESLDFISLPGSSNQWGKTNRELLPELSPEELKEELPEPLPQPLAPPGAAVAEAPEADAEAEATAEPAAQLPQEGSSVSGAAGMSAAANTSGSQAVAAPAPNPGRAAAAPAAPRRRRAEGQRPQRRAQQNVLMQLLKPPTSLRGWLLVSLNILIAMVIVSFCVVFADVVRNPPRILDPLPDPKN